jgi:hypothetical protein
LVLLLAAAATARAQTPYLQVYFDPDLTFPIANCPADPPGTVFGDIYIVAHDFGAWLNAIEFTVDYPPQLMWLNDIIAPGALAIGGTATGIAIAWPLPLNAFVPVVVAQSRFVWMCDNCGPPNSNVLVCIMGYPSSGAARATRWPDLKLIYAQSGTSVICGACGSWGQCASLPVPVREKTWGGIKALYR